LKYPKRTLANCVVAAATFCILTIPIAQAEPVVIAYDSKLSSHEQRMLAKLGNTEVDYIRIEFREATAEIPADLIRILRSVRQQGGQVRVLDESTNFEANDFQRLLPLLRGAMGSGLAAGGMVAVQNQKFGMYNAVIRGSFSDTGNSIYDISFIPKARSGEWTKQCSGSHVLDGTLLGDASGTNQTSDPASDTCSAVRQN
jgi:hypothetical protein